MLRWTLFRPFGSKAFEPSGGTDHETRMLKPGGLIELAVLTRAFWQLGILLDSMDWINEKKNQTWGIYRGISSKVPYRSKATEIQWRPILDAAEGRLRENYFKKVQ